MIERFNPHWKDLYEDISGLSGLTGQLHMYDAELRHSLLIRGLDNDMMVVLFLCLNVKIMQTWDKA